MDIGWYKDNIALQAELRREYPDVAGLIAELEQQITRYREVIAEQAHISAEHDVRMYAAEAQLSDARAEIESIGYKPLTVIKEEARQEAAKEIICKHIEFFIADTHDRRCLINSIRRTFKLEG